MDGCMDGWVSGWDEMRLERGGGEGEMDGWFGWMDGWMDGWMENIVIDYYRCGGYPFAPQVPLPLAWQLPLRLQCRPLCNRLST